MENDDFSINYQESFKQLFDYYQGIFKLVTFFILTVIFPKGF